MRLIGGEEGPMEGGEKVVGGTFEGEGLGLVGLVLFPVLPVCHHGHQWLHGSTQVISHVEQTAHAGTYTEGDSFH